MTPEDWVALDRYVAGEGSAEEREAMRQRMQASPNLAAIVEVMRASRLGPAESADGPPNVAEAWSSVSSTLGFESPQQRDRRRAPLALMPPASLREISTGKLVGIAASLLFIAGASFVSWRNLRVPPRTPNHAPAIRAEYRTVRGERATVELRDGTRVTLAPESELHVASVGRLVYLSGEAVFRVTHDPTHPLRVIAPNGAIVQDIGTQFDVRAYDKNVRVVVAEGSVSLGVAAHSIILPSGTLGLIDSTGAMQITRGVTTDPYLAWADGHLTFTNARMADVIPDLDRWLDIDVHLDAALADDRLTIALSDVPADVALDIIARALGARVVRSGQLATLSPR